MRTTYTILDVSRSDEKCTGKLRWRYSRSKTKHAPAMSVTFSAGTTKLGFISDGKIRTGESCVISGHTITPLEWVGTSGFDGDGFSLVLPRETTVVLPKGRATITVVAHGELKVDVPAGFFGFCLAGKRGRISEGSVQVGSNPLQDEGKADRPPFLIRYGNVKLDASNASNASIAPTCGPQ